jgi:hypothetical protein
VLTGNIASNRFGGAVASRLTNCTLVANTASNYAGVSYGTLRNCILHNNTTFAGVLANFNTNSTLDYCCTQPLAAGLNNISLDPSFVDYAAGNLRLQSNSPCINSGNNADVTTATDLDGRLRIVDGTVDMGAYEYQGPGMGEFLAWLEHYGLPTDGSADLADSDRDGINTWQEWLCRTSPINAWSVLRLLSPVHRGDDVVVEWQSVEGVDYFLERSTNLSVAPVFRTVATNLAGQDGTTTFIDTDAAGESARYYRVGVPAP